MQVLYQWDMRKQPWEEAVESYYESVGSPDGETRLARDEFIERLVQGTVERCAEIDARSVKHSEHWRLERMPAVDRNILRLAIYEMLCRDDIPPVVSINEAVDIAKKFSTRESGAFVNGILDRLKADLPRPGRTAAGETSDGGRDA